MEHDVARELAKLTLQIQEGRREFDALRAEKETFLKEREAEATERVAKALEMARAAVNETLDHYRTLEDLQKAAQMFVLEVSQAKELMQTERREFQKRVEDARDVLDRKGAELEEKVVEMRRERIHLDGLVESVRRERDMLKDEQKKIDDDRGKLHAAFQIWRKQSGTTTELPVLSLKTVE